MLQFLLYHHQLDGLIRRFNSSSILLQIFSCPFLWHSFSLLPLSLCLQQSLRHWYEPTPEQNPTIVSWKEKRNKKYKEMKIVSRECGTHEDPVETNKCRNYSFRDSESISIFYTSSHNFCWPTFLKITCKCKKNKNWDKSSHEVICYITSNMRILKKLLSCVV